MLRQEKKNTLRYSGAFNWVRKLLGLRKWPLFRGEYSNKESCLKIYSLAAMRAIAEQAEDFFRKQNDKDFEFS